jgi:predicted O-methyltransferase YrrM
MSDLLIENLNEYIDHLLPDRDLILQEMEKYAKLHDFPIIGPQAGRFLYQICQIMKPKSVFEMGSGFGYSAYWFCKGAPKAKVTLTDHSQKNLERAKNWLNQAGLIHQVTLIDGYSKEILQKSKHNYDIIFIDIDKHEYPDAFNLALSFLNKGGIIITDNVLWYGKVGQADQQDADTNSIRKFNRQLFNTPGIFSSIIPIRDGIAISIKLTDKMKENL